MMLDRIKSLSHCEIISYRAPKYDANRTWIAHTTIEGDVSYDDIKIRRIEDWERDHASSGLDGGRDYYLCPVLLANGKYGRTGIVGKANFRAFKTFFAKHCHTLYGWYNSFGIAISVNWLLQESDEALEIMGTLEALQDYPLISEDILSEVECELAEEAWVNHVKDDYRRGLEKRFDDDALRELFQKVLERENIYWQAVGNNMVIDLERVIKAT